MFPATKDEIMGRAKAVIHSIVECPDLGLQVRLYLALNYCGKNLSCYSIVH